MNRESISKPFEVRQLTPRELEVNLREQADAAMRVPPASLRLRTIDGLRRSSPAQTVQRSHRRFTAMAMAAVCALAATASVVVLVSRPTSNQSMPTANETTRAWKSLVQLGDTAATDLRLDAANPLAREARLIVNDARHTVRLLKSSLPMPPRFDRGPDSESGSGSEPALNSGA